MKQMVWIRKNNEDKWREVDDKSALINQLLGEHWKLPSATPNPYEQAKKDSLARQAKFDARKPIPKKNIK